MCNADREFEIRFPWFAIGLFAYLSVGACFAGIVVAFGLDPDLRFSSVAARIGISCLAEAEAVLFGYPAIRWTIQRVQRRQRLVFTDTAIIITDGIRLWSRNPKSVPYADLKKARYTTIGQMRTIKIVFAGGSFHIGAPMLPQKTDFDELLSELTRRLEQSGMEVETREFLWYRPQFSLRFMLIVTAVVAVLLGLRRWMDPEFHLRDWALVLFCIYWILLNWLILFGNWSARIFAIGFALGMGLEWHLVFLSLGGRIPQGPYSSTMICKQMLMIPGNLFQYDHFWWLFLGGMMISGIVVGAASLLAWRGVKLAMRGRRGRDTSSGS